MGYMATPYDTELEDPPGIPAPKGWGKTYMVEKEEGPEEWKHRQARRMARLAAKWRAGIGDWA